jgi:hypothetical protein
MRLGLYEVNLTLALAGAYGSVVAGALLVLVVSGDVLGLAAWPVS